jgi:hypothetical protein
MGGAGITSHIGAIGGSEIRIYNSRYGNNGKRLPLIKRLLGGNGNLCVGELIEGDVVALECVVAPKVVGRVVAIGDGCEIDLVQYSEEIEISDKAKVGRCEKI